MKRTSSRFFLVGLVLLCLGGVSSVWSDPPTRVGRLSYLSGTVSYHPETVEDWAVATLNYPLTIGDSLWTDNDGEAEVQVGTTAIRLAPNTDISFLNLDDRAIQIRLSTGSLDIRLRTLGPNEEIELDTPNASLSLLRAGSYRVDVLQSGDTTATARSGEIEVTAGTSVFPLRQQQTVTINGTDSPTHQIAPAPPLDAWDQWCQARDQKEDHIASAQYVPPNEVDGVEDLDQYGSWSVDPTLGPVWTPAVTVVGWAPYRFGHWAWVDPWGWTWIDDAPWGFAPFHYGRWTYRNNAWAWVPGAHIGHPVYAPALVTFVGGPGWRPEQAPGESVGWFPLGPHEPYVAPYRSDKTRQHNIDVEHFNYVNRNVPGAVTVVPNDAFIRGQPTSQAALRPQGNGWAQAPVRGGVAPLVPQKESVLGGNGVARGNSVARPPAAAVSRPVVARLAPAPQVAPFASRQQSLAAHPGQPLVVGTTANARQPTPANRPQVKIVTPGYQRAGSGQPAPVPSGQPGGGQPVRPSGESQGAPAVRPPQNAVRPPAQGATTRQSTVRQPTAPAQPARTPPQAVRQPQANRAPPASNPARATPGVAQPQLPLIEKKNGQ